MGWPKSITFFIQFNVAECQCDLLTLKINPLNTDGIAVYLSNHFFCFCVSITCKHRGEPGIFFHFVFVYNFEFQPKRACLVFVCVWHKCFVLTYNLDICKKKMKNASFSSMMTIRHDELNRCCPATTYNLLFFLSFLRLSTSINEESLRSLPCLRISISTLE